MLSAWKFTDQKLSTTSTIFSFSAKNFLLKKFRESIYFDMKSAHDVDSAAYSISSVLLTLSHLVKMFRCGKLIWTIADTDVRQVAMYLVGSVRYVASVQYAAHRLNPLFCMALASLCITSRCEYSSIWPGQSKRIKESSANSFNSSISQSMFSTRCSMQYTRPPFGPKFSSCWTSSSEIKSRMSMSHLYLKTSAAGSKLHTLKMRPFEAPTSCKTWHSVD